MESSKTKLLYKASFVLLPIFLMSNAAAEETIIQQEKISFEKCLKVITTSQDKLSIAPEIKDISDQNHHDEFAEGPSKFIQEISNDWQRFDFFNEGVLDNKPSSTGLTILKHA